MDLQSAVRNDLATLDLGDLRRNRRGQALAASMAARPGVSLPRLTGSTAEREANYRFIGSEHVDPAALLEPHRRATAARAASAKGRLLVIHDGTEMKFTGNVKREGLGMLPNGTQGFIAHPALCADIRGEVRDPLGITSFRTVFRDNPKGQRGHVRTKAGEGEGLVWLENIRDSELLLGARAAVHVGDRAADSYKLMATLEAERTRFVFRSQYDRRTLTSDGEVELLKATLPNTLEMKFTRTVRLSSRGTGELDGPKKLKGASYNRSLSKKRMHPARTERNAELDVSAGSIRLIRPKDVSSQLGETLAVHVVRVRESNPPGGQEPVEWLILTNEPITTAEDVARIVDTYRARWLIEEYFKALKTGCGYEKLQVELRPAFLNLLALMMPLALQLLRLRALARTCADAPATDVMTPTQLIVLRVVCKQKLPEQPTLRDWLTSITFSHRRQLHFPMRVLV